MPANYSFIGLRAAERAVMGDLRGLSPQSVIYFHAHVWSLVKAYCEQLDETLGADQQKELSARLDQQALRHIEIEAQGVLSLAEKQYLEHMHKALRKTIEKGASSS